ncbi:L-threonylcarbamoyladenylate synthase [Curvibacter sp. APW13]|nr:L-threonylcarbamoyladenylate synthase [Curvibacter sp. APW13]MDT8990087.1 L-threonylcarbamoyladenylate synthase [Curvibacter sp. APW13]
MQSVAACADIARAGGLFGMPTETVYGLAADADNAQAVAQIFATKGRPADHPLIVHLAARSHDDGVHADATLREGVDHYCPAVPDFARALMTAFWPGPLTLIVPRRAGVGAAAAGGQDSIGLRCPAHPLAQAVLSALRSPASGQSVVWGLAAPSANRFGRVSPTLASHVEEEFEGRIAVLDGGACDVGIESTIIDCTRGEPVLLRPGAITAEQVWAACGRKLLSKDELPAHSAPGPRASGTLESHYAPSARVRLMDAASMQSALDGQDATTAVRIAVYARSSVHAPASVFVQPMPAVAADAAHELFAMLRALDARGVGEIWVETPPVDSGWDGVRDRLQRAAA